MFNSKNFKGFNKKILLGLLTFVYLLFLFAFLNIFQFSELFKAFTVLPLIVLIPHQLGEFIVYIIYLFAKKNLRKDSVDFDHLSFFLICWSLGIYFLLAFFVFFLVILDFSSKITTLIIIFFIIIKIIIFKLNFQEIETKNLIFKDKHTYLSIIFGFVPSILVKLRQPFPLLASYGILNYNFNTLRFINSTIVLSPEKHIPTISSLVGSLSLIFNINPIYIYSTASIFLYPIFSFGVYLFSYKVTNNKFISILSSFLCVWLMSLQIFKHLHAFIPRSILLAIFPYVLYALYLFLTKNVRSRHHKVNYILLILSLNIVVTLLFIAKIKLDGIPMAISLIVIGMLVFTLLVYINKTNLNLFFIFLLILSVGLSFSIINLFESMLYMIIINFILLYYAFIKRNIKLIYILFITILFFIVLQKLGYLNFRDNLILSKVIFGDKYYGTFVDINFENKFIELIKANTKFVTYFYITALVILSILYKKYKKIAVITFLSNLTLLIFFLPEGHFHRIMGPHTIFMSIIISYFIFINTYNNKYNKILRALLLLTILLGVISNAVIPLQKQIMGNSPFSWFSKDDVVAAEILDNLGNINSNIVVVSDPYTMFVLQGLTGIKTPFSTRAWVMEEEYPEEDLQIGENIRQLLKTHDDKIIYNGIRNIKKSKTKYNYILVINSRTLSWVSNQEVFFDLTPKLSYINKIDLIRILNNSQYFYLVKNLDNKVYFYFLMEENYES